MTTGHVLCSVSQAQCGSLPLASSLSVKSQAPVLDSRLDKAKESSAVQLKKKKFERKARASQASVFFLPVFRTMLYICQENKANGAMFQPSLCPAVLCAVPLWWVCSVMPIFAPSTEAQRSLHRCQV